MVSIPDLWLPIVLSAVAVFIASAMAWMVLPHHKDDWTKMPSEDALLARIRELGIPPGQYMFPFCSSPGEMKDPEVKRRVEAGPHGTLTVWPGMPSMARNMIVTFIFFLVTGIFIAYLASRTLRPGAEFLEVFRVTGTAGVLAYCFAGIPNGIWFGRKARSVAMDIVDGIFEGLVTGAIFAALWPAAAA